MARLTVGLILIAFFLLALAVQKPEYRAHFLPGGILFFLAPGILLVTGGLVSRRRAAREAPRRTSQRQSPSPAPTGFKALESALDRAQRSPLSAAAPQPTRKPRPQATDRHEVRFLFRCPVCRWDLGKVTRPAGVMSDGTVVCFSCKSQVA
jgi:hypothetical protein